MLGHPNVAIFWDYENCNPPSSSCGLGYDIVNNISRIARIFGSVTTFRAYLDISAQSSKSVALRSELQSSGVSMVDCPHNGRKDVVDKMILVDMLAFAVDHPAPATFILITGDRDYAYAVSTLKLRKYQVVLVVPSSPHTSQSLECQASLVIDWAAAALRTRAEVANSTQPIRQPYVELDANLVSELLGELHDPPLDNANATVPPNVTSSPDTPSLRRITTRDLLEPSRHCKNARNLDSTQDLGAIPASPKKSTTTGSDPAFGGLPIPKTPSRDRRASLSAGSTRARSTTAVGHSPPAVGKSALTNKSPPSDARSSIISDVTDIEGSSPSVLPLLDTLELPVHDSCPPLSIVVRSPLQSSQSMLVSEKPPDPSSHKLNRLALPFVLTKAPTVSGSIPDSCAKQPCALAGFTSPTVPSAKILSETGHSAWGSPQIRAVATGYVDDNDIHFRPSISHPLRANEGARNDTCTPPCYAAPHTTYFPSSARAGLELTDTPPSKPAFPVATSSRVDDSVDSPPVPLPCSSSALGRPVSSGPEPLSSNTLLSTHERDENGRPQAWAMFEPLIHTLLAFRERGLGRPSRSMIAVDLVQSDKLVYRRAGVSKFRDYTALAEQAGIIELGGREAGAWVALHPNWFGVNSNSSAHPTPNGGPSPASDPPKVIQSPLLMGLKTPLMERTTVFQSSTFASPGFDSPKNSNAHRRAFVPAQFLPLIDILIRTRAEGFHQTLRSVVGQLLGQDVYARAGVSGFKEYVHQAWEAQVIQLGGVGGHAWIRLHPELRPKLFTHE